MRRATLLALALLVVSFAAHGEDAEDLYKRGAWSEAAQAFEERLAKRRDVATLIAAGNCYAQMNSLDRAIARYEEALRLDSKASDAARNLGRAFYRVGRYREAASALARGGAATDAEELRLYASALSLAEDADAAALALERAVLASPDDGRVRRDLGVAYVRAGRPVEGTRALRAAIERDGSLLDAWVPLAQAHIGAGQTDDAIVALEMAARLGAADRPALNLLADLELEAKLPKAAATAYENALARDGKRDTETLERLGIARLRAGNPAGALAVLEEALAKEPSRGLARLSKAEALAALGRRDDARAILEGLRESGPRALQDAARARLELLR